MSNPRSAVVLGTLVTGFAMVACASSPPAKGTGGATGSSSAESGSTSSASGTSSSGSAASGSSGSTTSGTSSSSGTGGTSTAGECPANAIFCADFESGSIPAAAVFYPAYQQSTMATYLTVDATMGNHGSAHSLKVTPGSNFSQMLGVKTGQPTFWTRVYLQTETVNTSAVTGHDTFLAGLDSTAGGGTLANAGDPNNGELFCLLCPFPKQFPMFRDRPVPWSFEFC